MIKFGGESILWDCGEGSQRQMMKMNTGMGKITSIYLTHFHSDHTLGIPGFIQTMDFNGRTDPLTIYGPKKTELFTNLLNKLGYARIGFPLESRETKGGDVIKRRGYKVHAVETNHSVSSLGFVFQEDDRLGKFNKQKALDLGIKPGPLYAKLHRGETVEVNGRLIDPSEIVGKPRPGRKVAYSGDTRPSNALVNASKGADLLIHDSTLSMDISHKAEETFHSTAREAAEVAVKAEVKLLALTHISPRYSKDPSRLLEEAKEIFPNTVLAHDFFCLDIKYPS